MSWHITITDPGSVLPVSAQEIADHLRLDSSDDAGYVATVLAAAREYVEGATGRATTAAEYRMTAESWDAIRHGRGGNFYAIRIAGATGIESIKYWPSDDGDQVTIDPADYIAITKSNPQGFLLKSPPDLADRPDAIEVAFTAGSATAGNVRAGMKHAIKILTAHWYEHRANVVTGTIATPIPDTLMSLILQNREGGFTA
jgi:uncharacterized phiE125 gp8 family phage protein